uniref:Uncharacterized protein n=1 Tax=Amphimedon queenslandica TaxID=400682 RepID=A0A1X7VL55_AMPQE
MTFNIVLILYASGAKISTADTEEETLKTDNEAKSESDLIKEISNIKGKQVFGLSLDNQVPSPSQELTVDSFVEYIFYWVDSEKKVDTKFVTDTGIYLLEIAAPDPAKYALALMDAIFSDAEMANCFYKASKRTTRPGLD